MKTRLGFFLSLWSFVFACVHIAWALGWRGGLDPSFAPISERPWFLAYDLLAGLLMYAAAFVAWRLARGDLPRDLTHRLCVLTFIGSGLALGRGVPALMWDAAAGETGLVSLGADIWFTVAGLAGFALALGVRRGTLIDRPHAASRHHPGPDPSPRDRARGWGSLSLDRNGSRR